MTSAMPMQCYEATQFGAGQFVGLVCPRKRTDEYHKSIYYIKTNEIPSELSGENMLSSHVKRSLFLWLHIKNAPFDAFREMI